MCLQQNTTSLYQHRDMDRSLTTSALEKYQRSIQRSRGRRSILGACQGKVETGNESQSISVTEKLNEGHRKEQSVILKNVVQSRLVCDQIFLQLESRFLLLRAEGDHVRCYRLGLGRATCLLKSEMEQSSTGLL